MKKEVRKINNFLNVRQKAKNELEIYIYGDIEPSEYGDHGNFVVSGKELQKKISEYADVKDIKVYINSYGGNVDEGICIYNQLCRHVAKKTIYIDGFACSIASVIAMAGDTVIMPRSSLMMIHDPWSFSVGNAEDFRKAAEDLEKISTLCVEAYLKKTDGKIDKDTLLALIHDETWLTPNDCLTYGFADEIEGELDKKQNRAKEFRQFFQQSGQWSKYLSDKKDEENNRKKTMMDLFKSL